MAGDKEWRNTTRLPGIFSLNQGRRRAPTKSRSDPLRPCRRGIMTTLSAYLNPMV